MGAWDAWIGRSETREDILTPGLLARFNATLDRTGDGNRAPQGGHWCLCLPDAPTTMLGQDGHPLRDQSPASFLPPIPLPRRMWASSAVEFLGPLHAGEPIRRVSTIEKINEKTGNSGTLVFVDVRHETYANGAKIVQERQTIVYREASSAPATPRPADCAEPPISDWQWHRTITPAEPLLFRYSALTFNSHRIHYDLPYAQGEEGYRGLVVHGPLMATLLLDLAAHYLGADALRYFAFRGQAPAFAGEPLYLVGKQNGPTILLAALGGDGRTIMSAEGAI
jgi:3-methylfumaryl-CoA hydratase